MTQPVFESQSERAFFEHMHEQIAATPLPARSLRRRPLPVDLRTLVTRSTLTLASAGLTLLAALVTAVIAIGVATDSRPGYAVTLKGTHTVTITLNSFGAISRLNARLAALRTRIRVVPVVRSCEAPVRDLTRASGTHALTGFSDPRGTLRVNRRGSTLSETIAATIPAGLTLVIPVTSSGRRGLIPNPAGRLVAGAAPACVAA